MNKFVNLICMGLVLCSFLMNSCKKKEEVPSLTTTAISDITGTTAAGGGTITSEGSGPVISRGVCWSISDKPTISDSHTSDGTGLGSFSSNITGLNGAKNYYVRAYATNEFGTGYGPVVSFMTLGTAPVVNILETINILQTRVSFTSEVNASFLPTNISIEYGSSTNYGNSVVYAQNPLTGNTNTIINLELTGLNPASTYHCRIKAENELGITYSNDILFYTLNNFSGYYNFEEINGNLLPQSGSIEGIVYGNAARQQPGKNNFSYFFNGSSAINLGENSYRFTTDFTISGWFKTTGLSTPGALFTRYFSSSGYRCYSSHISTSGEIKFFVYSPESVITNIVSPTNSVTPNSWYHIVLLKRGATMKIILNGAVVASTSSAPVTLNDRLGSSYDLKTFIGADSKSNTIPDTFFNGYIDEVAIWNIGLPDEQISSLWNNGKGSFYKY